MHTLHTPRFDRDHHLDPSSSRSSSDMSFSGEIWAQRDSSVSACMSDVDLEMGNLEGKVHFLRGKAQPPKRDCRICHLGLEGNEEDCGVAIELGCSCKGDMGAAHRICAETWFNLRGNKVCEICGATALNIAGEQTNDVQNINAAVSIAPPTAPMILLETPTFWHSRRVMNILLACMVLAFIISWLFHFKILV